MTMYKTNGKTFSECVKEQDISSLNLAHIERSPYVVAHSEWSSEMRRLHNSFSPITVDNSEFPLIMAIDDGFYERFPQLKQYPIAVRKNHSLFSGFHITGPPKMPGFSRPIIENPIKTMIFKNTARVKERAKKIKKAAKIAAKQKVIDIKNIQKSVTLALFKRNRYDLLGEELDDFVYDSPIAKQPKIKAVRIKKMKIPQIRIFKIKEYSTPIFDSAVYYKNLTPSALSTRSNVNEAAPQKPNYAVFVKNFKKMIQEPVFQDQAWSEIGELFSMDCILTSLMSNISMDDFLKSLEKLKPINLANLIGMALAAQDFKTVLGIITAAFELYDFFWTVPSNSTHIFCLFLAYAVFWLIKLIKHTFSDSDDPPPNMFWDEAAFLPTDEQNTVRDWLKNNLKLDLEQIPECVLPLVAGIVGVIALITGGTFVNWADLKFSKILKRLQSFTKSLKTIDNAMEMVPKVFTNVISSVAGLFGYEYVSSEDKCIIDFKAELLEFKKDVTNLSDMMQVEPVALLQSSEKLTRMAKVMEELDKQYEKLIRQKFNTNSVKPILDDIKTAVKKIHNWARIRNQETATKVEPVFLQLSGAPGVGKSRIVSYILEKLAIKAGRTERFTTYTRNCCEKFWANYAGQDVVVIDEFNQTKEDSDHNDVMTVKNPNKSSVNMAIAEEKGQQFTSLFIIACSNGLDVLASATIKWGEALNRRRDVLVLVDDPNLDAFKKQYNCFPGAYVDEENGTVGAPMVERELEIMVEDQMQKVKVTIPYFDPQFRHLTFWEIPSLPSCRTEAYKRTNPDKIVNLMIAHHQKFLSAYKASLVNSNLLLSEIPEVVDKDVEINSDDGSLASSISAAEYYELLHKNATPDEAIKNLKVEPSIARPPDTQKEIAKINRLAKQQKINARELKQHYETQFWNEPSCSDDYPIYEDHDAKTSAKAFVNCAGKKGKVFSIVGPAGTGKSRFLDLVQQHWGNHVDRVHASNLHKYQLTDKRILIIDDASLTKTSAQLTFALTNAVYDGESPIKLLYISYNKISMDTYYSGDDERQMFLRRCHPIRVDFNIKKKNLLSKDEYYTYEDTEKATPVTFPKMVFYTDIRERKIIDSTQLHQLLVDVDVDLKEVVTTYCVNVPEIDPLTVKPEFIVKFDLPMFEACKILYNNPATMISWITTGKAKIEKGSALEGIAIARQFTTPAVGEKPCFPENLDTFICMINNCQFMSEKPFITRLDAPDCSLIIMPKSNNPKLIRCFRVNASLEFLRDAIRTKGTEEEKEMMNEATKQEYGDYFDFIQQHTQEVEQAVAKADEQLPILAGAAALFDKAPFLKNAFSVCAFYLRFIMAGTAISSLLSHHETCKILFEKNFIPKNLEDEKKRQRIKYDAQIYEDFRGDIDNFGSKSAKKLKVKEALRVAYDHFGHTDYSREDFRNFLTTYNESRDVQIPTANQKFVPATQAFDPALVPNLMIESKPLVYDEAMIDSSSKTIMTLCSDHAVSIGKRQGGVYTHLVHGLMVRGHIGCSVAHFVESDCDYFAQYLQNGEVKTSPIKILKKSKDFDISIFKIEDKTCSKFKNIIHFLPTTTTNINQISENVQGILQTTTLNARHKFRDNLPRNVRLDNVVTLTSNSGPKTSILYKGTITQVRTQGQILTEAGDCGSPIILCNPKSPVKILAIHNCADTEFGAGSLIFQEYFRFFDDEARYSPPEKIMTHSAVDLKDHQTDFVCDMPVVGIGSVNVSLPTKTKIWTSPLKLDDANPYQPAILSQFDSRNPDKIHPFYKSVSKWAHVQPQLNEEILNQAVEEIAEFYANTCFINGETCKVLSTTDAINAGGSAGLCQLNRATSPGYPWTRLGSRKQDFLKMNGKNEDVYWSIDYDFVHPKLNCKPGQLLSDALNMLIQTCKSGPEIKPLIIFAGHIKDEPVKLKKIYSVSSRSFAGAPFDYVIAMRRYYGAAVSAIHNVRHIVPSKIGINPTSMEWHNMFIRMLEVSDIGFDADYQNFDSTVPAIVLKKIPIIYNRIYQKCDKNWTEEDDLVRTNLNNALVEPLLSVPEDGLTKIVRAPGGHVSGQPLTADTNCLVNLIYLYMCWLETFKHRVDYCNFNSFLANVEAIIYGDDICVAVNPDVILDFNCQTLYHYLASIGITITDAAKTPGVPKQYIKCTDFEFLKRNFVKKGMYYFGPLKEASFQKMLGYTVGDPHCWDRAQHEMQFSFRILQSTMESAMQEAVFHGPKFYDYIKNHCLKFCRDYNWQFIPLNYNQMVDFKGVPLPKI